jgi:hypothetical protein
LFFRGLASCEWKVKLVKLRYNWNDSRWHKRGIHFHLTSVPRVKCFTFKFTFTWLLFPGSSVLLSSLLSLDFCSQGQVFYFKVCAEQLTNF